MAKARQMQRMQPKVSATSTDCAVLVIGSGAAGLAAAIAAADSGLEVLLVERESVLGGTSAISGGWMYVPGNKSGRAMGDTREDIECYLQALSGSALDRERLGAFLDVVPEMLDFFERETELRFVYPDKAPDYHMSLPGARAGGRAIYAESFDGRQLGSMLDVLRPPMWEMTVFGVVPQIGPELNHFINANRSARSFTYVAARIAVATAMSLKYGRSINLSNGNALVARLLKTAHVFGVDIRPLWAVTALTVDGGRVSGAEVETPEGRRTIRASRGVVLACGGFSHDESLRRQTFPHSRNGQPHYSAVTQAHDGTATRLATAVGGAFVGNVLEPAAWAPVTVWSDKRATRLFPHLRGIGLPGVIAVNRQGLRFTNEADSYHDFGRALIRDNQHQADAIAFLVADATTVNRYGIGYAKPWPIPRWRYLRTGYLLSASTLTELADKAGINSDNLMTTVKEFNDEARVGKDSLFHRGESFYNRFRGDSRNFPNPSLGPVEKSPFFAVRVDIGDLGSFAGLSTDGGARVLNEDSEPIEGLYAVGAAALSVFGGAYPGYGAMLGPGLAFGFKVGRELAASS
jgi:succinate dehydrogenase/fumarate reductase flavoprotein subunit